MGWTLWNVFTRDRFPYISFGGKFLPMAFGSVQIDLIGILLLGCRRVAWVFDKCARASRRINYFYDFSRDHVRDYDLLFFFSPSFSLYLFTLVSVAYLLQQWG